MALWRISESGCARYDQPNKGRIQVPFDVYENYPGDLISLVQRCLEPDPKHRIRADVLLTEITRIVQQYPGDFDSLPMKFDGLESANLVITQPDLYANFAQ